jgi:hypothetical protein
VGLHLLLLCVAAFLPGGMVVKLGGALLIPLHLAARWPRLAPRIVRDRDGVWAIPALGLANLRLGPRTRYTTLWIRLSLVTPERARDIVLLVDQFDDEVWRALQAWLRGAGGAGRPTSARPGASARGSGNLR